MYAGRSYHGVHAPFEIVDGMGFPWAVDKLSGR